MMIFKVEDWIITHNMVLIKKTDDPSPSWNVKKANWEVFKKLADENFKNINQEQHHLNKLTQLITEAILDAAKKSIPRDRRKKYTPGGTTNYRSCMMRSAKPELHRNKTLQM